MSSSTRRSSWVPSRRQSSKPETPFTSFPASQVGDMPRTIKKGSVVVAVGTKKGGFLFHSSDRRKWSVAGPFMVGNLVYHMILDPRDGRTVYGAAPVWRDRKSTRLNSSH